MVGDQGWLIVGYRFLPEQGSINLFPQNGNFNVSAFKTIKNDYARYVNAGYQVDFEHTLVEIVDVLNHKDCFHPIIKKGQELIAALGKTEGVFLLIADSNFDYEIKFEYQDMNRWKISKLGGGSGVPIGIE
jgi:hypothetical protein